MDPLALSTEALLLIVRFAVLLALYFFIWQVLAVVWRDLRRPAPGEVEPARPAGRLIVVDGGSTSYPPGYAFPIQGSVSIGRGPDNALVLADSFVSANHSILAFRDGGWWLADLDARNGTWVNGRRITGEARVRPGDLIAVGKVKLKLTG